MHDMEVMASGRADPNRRVMLLCFGLMAAFNLIDCPYAPTIYAGLKAFGFVLVTYGIYRNGSRGPFAARALGQDFSRAAWSLQLIGFVIVVGAFIAHVLG